MMLALAYQWPVRCAKCGHRGTINAAVADLAGQDTTLRSMRPPSALCA
jgi:hypothetical protein